MPAHPNSRENFLRRVIMIPEAGCWLWTAAVLRVGYGKSSLRGKTISAHRLAWKLFVGEIADDQWVLHRCDVALCVNPSHLFLGTAKENSQGHDSQRPTQRGSHKSRHEDFQTYG